MGETRTVSFPEGDPVDELVADCLARLSLDGVDPIEEVCAAHPELASELRRRREGLVALGLWKTRPVQAPRIGPFQVLRELGRGGMGVVFLAHQQEPLNRLVAVKVIAAHAPRALLARFEAERQVLAGLTHPHIAQVLEAGQTDDGQPWYAMEFVDGRGLTGYCDQRRLSIRARLEVFLQVCEAVQFAHQRGVLHRDLKPGNILVQERGGTPVVKVIDFGLAKLLEPDAAAPELTEAGQILGTPEYMAPEQALPTAAGIDTRCDVYALGSILYELVAGALPFDFQELRKSGFRALQRAVCELDAPAASLRLRQLGELASVVAERAGTSLASLLRQVAGDVDWIAQKALQKDRERRYATVSELAADVRRHLADQPVLAGPPSALYQLKKFVRRHAVSVTFSAVLLLGVLVSLVVVGDLLVQRNENLRRFDTLQVSLDCDRLERERDELLWPPVPDKVPAMDRWLDEVQHLVAQLPAIRALRDRVAADGRAVEGVLQFEAPRDAALHRELGPIIARLEALTQQPAAAVGGPFATAPIDDVASRRAWAADLQRLTIDATAEQWREAIATIADRDACPAYDGMVIAPQLGFVPLGRDERTQLYEFAWLQPGLAPPQRVDGRLVIDDSSCLVFVLIPAGVARLGLDWPDERLVGFDKDHTRPHTNEFLIADEELDLPTEQRTRGSSERVHLDAFLISKFEVTQAQWLRTMGSNPSFWRKDNWKRFVTDTHPVGNLSGIDVSRFLRRCGLVAPTGAQWEYAARAGADGPWWTGFSREGWHGRENLADASHVRANGIDGSPKGQDEGDYDDGFPLTCPVDHGEGNAFGLFHVMGNVAEWTVDVPLDRTRVRPRPGRGELEWRPPWGGEMPTGRARVFRGSFATDWREARSTHFYAAPHGSSAPVFGRRSSRSTSRRRPPESTAVSTAVSSTRSNRRAWAARRCTATSRRRRSWARRSRCSGRTRPCVAATTPAAP